MDEPDFEIEGKNETLNSSPNPTEKSGPLSAKTAQSKQSQKYITCPICKKQLQTPSYKAHERVHKGEVFETNLIYTVPKNILLVF